MSDPDIISLVDSTYGNAARPPAFTVADGDLECTDHEETLQKYTVETLPQSIFISTYSPLSELLLPGFRYLFPKIVRFVLDEDAEDTDWLGYSLLYRLSDDAYLTDATIKDKEVVSTFLKHLEATRGEHFMDYLGIENWKRLCARWQPEA